MRIRSIGLLAVGLVAAGTGVAGIGCSGGSSPHANATLVVDDYATLPDGTELRLAVNDAAGVLLDTIPDDGSGTFSANIPSGGSITLVTRTTNPASYFLSDWVAPPVGQTIHATVFGMPIPTPVDPGDGTTWSVTVSDVPPSTNAVSVFERCGVNSSIGGTLPLDTSGIMVQDYRCASSTPSSLLATARDGGQRPLAWGLATNLTAAPGTTVPVTIPLSGPIDTVTEEVLNAPSPCTVATEFTMPEISDVFGGLIVDQVVGTGMVPVKSLGGATGTASLLTSCNRGASVSISSSVTPIPATPTFDAGTFPSIDPISTSIVAGQHTVSWNLGAPFGVVGELLVEWNLVNGPAVVFTAWMPPDRTDFAIPELPVDVPAPAEIGTMGVSPYALITFVDISGWVYADALNEPWGFVPEGANLRTLQSEPP